MEHSSSVDDLVGTFWAESGAHLQLGEKEAAALGSINRSSSEWSFQEFLRESLGAAGPACKSRFLAGLEDMREDPMTAVQEGEDEPYERAPELQLYPNSGTSSSCSDSPQVQLSGAESLQTVPDNVGGAGSNSQDYERLLKQKLEMACAAVATTRVLCLDYVSCN